MLAVVTELTLVCRDDSDAVSVAGDTLGGSVADDAGDEGVAVDA